MSHLPTLDPQETEVFDIHFSPEPLKRSYEIGLVITTFNRPAYLHRTLSALGKSRLDDTLVLLVDDCSDDPHTTQLIDAFSLAGTAVIKAERKSRGECAIHENLTFGWDLLLKHFQCRYLTNLDSDAVVQADWLVQLKQLSEQAESKDALITGFNAYQHNTLKEQDTHYEKESIGGINFFFSRSMYQDTIRPALVDLQWDHHVVETLQKTDRKILCTKPSVVQHIGRNGIWSGPASGIFDFAIDFGDTNVINTFTRMLYFRGCRKTLFLLSPVFSGISKLLKKINFLPRKLTDAIAATGSRIKGLWFRARYARLYS